MGKKVSAVAGCHGNISHVFMYLYLRCVRVMEQVTVIVLSDGVSSLKNVPPCTVILAW
jgi:hypothetical protein